MDIEEVVIEETYYERRRVGSVGGELTRDAGEAPTETELARFGRCRQHTGRRDRRSLCSSFIHLDDGVLLDETQAQSIVRHGLEIGTRGETAAARYLERVGIRIVERNWTCPFGEADIIAVDGSTLVFIEVKTRTGISKGFPSEAVDARKRARYEKIAAWYLKDYGEVDIPVRFDVIALMVVSPSRAFMKHYVNAFGVES